MKKKLETISFTNINIEELTKQFQRFLDELEGDEKVKDFSIIHITSIVELKSPGPRPPLYSFMILYDLEET